jgi:hypothetical protein
VTLELAWLSPFHERQASVGMLGCPGSGSSWHPLQNATLFNSIWSSYCACRRHQGCHCGETETSVRRRFCWAALGQAHCFPVFDYVGCRNVKHNGGSRNYALKCADFFTLDVNVIAYAGGLSDPVAAVVFCAPTRARHTVVGGRLIADQGEIVTLDMAPVIRAHNRNAARLVLSEN